MIFIKLYFLILGGKDEFNKIFFVFYILLVLVVICNFWEWVNFIILGKFINCKCKVFNWLDVIFLYNIVCYVWFEIFCKFCWDWYIICVEDLGYVWIEVRVYLELNIIKYRNNIKVKR